MTTVPPVSSTGNSTGASTASAVGALDYNAFLKLLITQLKNQDPSQPMDSTQFVAQLATFSQVEQSIHANSKLGALLTSNALAIADSVIGRTVISADGLTTGVVTSVRITNDGPVAAIAGGGEVMLGAGISVS